MDETITTAALRKRKGFSHTKKAALRIDMTPMVDLAFLLITFFVFTTNLSQPTTIRLHLPADNIAKRPTLPESLALSVLLDADDRIYYYHGNWEAAEKKTEIFATNYSTFSGLGEVIRQKQKAIDASRKFPEGRNGLMLLIKPGKESTYQNLVNALDEALINDVKKYAIMEPASAETSYLKKKFN